MMLQNLLSGEQMSKEKAQLCKSTSYNQLQQSIYLCHKRNMSQIKSHHDAHLHPLTNVPTKCQPSTPYKNQEPGQDFMSQSRYGKVKGQIKVTP